MNIGEIVEPGDAGQPTGPMQSGQSFWKDQTAEQLREILDRGLAAGDAFIAAAAEIERRASETARRARQAPVEQDEARQRRLLLVKLAVLLAAVAIGAATALYQFFS
jgi:hypothetical protein